MLTSVNPKIERDCIIRISPGELFCDEADFEGSIPVSEVKDVRLERRHLNPLALIVPAIAGGLGGIVFWLFAIKPLPEEKRFLLIVPLLLCGYAVHAAVHFFKARRHIIQVIAPALRKTPIDFYVTESSFDAALLLDELHAALPRKKANKAPEPTPTSVTPPAYERRIE